MQLTEQELRQLVREVISRKLEEKKELQKEARDYSARREVVLAAERAAMDFEQQIVQLLGLVHPDELRPEIQRQYHAVVKQMSDELTSAVMGAARQLSKFPKQDDGSNKGKK
jgi:hypothetical protein